MKSEASIRLTQPQYSRYDDRTMAVGIPEIDDQHRRLFELVDQLDAIRSADDSRRQVEEALSFLADYTMNHFNHEEALMEQHRCPSVAKNRKEHRQLLKLVERWQAEVPECTDPLEMAKRITQALRGWLACHILGIDSCLKSCRAAKSV